MNNKLAMCKRILLYSLICQSFIFYVVNASVSNFGDKCSHTAECADHRLVCEKTSDTNSTKICLCDRFHKWNGTSLGCVQNFSIEHILALLNEKYNIADHIEREADFIFFAQIFAGFLVLFVGLSCSIIILFYCYHIKNKDNKLKEVVAHLKSIQEQRNETTNNKKKNQQSTS